MCPVLTDVLLLGVALGAGGAKEAPCPRHWHLAALPLGLHNPCRLGVTCKVGRGERKVMQKKVITA